jgi:hypothetical protein
MSWRRSQAFEKLMGRMLLVMAFGTTGGMGLLIMAQRQPEFGTHTRPWFRTHSASSF